MALTLEEIKKLPPKERVEALKAFEAQEKKRLEDEEKARQKLKKDAEEILKKSIEEVALEDEEAEKKAKEKDSDKKESLEDIAKEAETNKQYTSQNQQEQQQMQYGLAQKPAVELYQDIVGIRNSFREKGYLSPDQQNQMKTMQYAMEKKQDSGYVPDEKAQLMMTEGQRMLHELQQPKQRYLR